LGLMVSKYAPVAKKPAAWLEQTVPEGLTVFDFPADHRRRLRTNNGLERLNREIKRRTRVASIFPNEPSLLRLATAGLVEIDDEWQTEKRYLPTATPQPDPEPRTDLQKNGCTITRWRAWPKS